MSANSPQSPHKDLPPPIINTPQSSKSATAQTRPKSSSFSNILRPKMTPSSTPGGDSSKTTASSTSASTGSGGGGGKLTQKVKEIFSKDKRQSSSTSLSSEGTTKALSANGTEEASPKLISTSPPTGPGSLRKPSNLSLQAQLQPNQSALQITVKDKESKFDFHRDDDFRQAVDSAQKSVDRLTTAAFWLGAAAQGLAAGAGWLPMVGEGVKAVVAMLQSAQNISVAKVAALRLVERCARVMEAVLRALERHNAQISVSMRSDVDRLLINIHSTARLLFKLSDRPFFKLWLHSNEVYDQIEEASDDLKAFMDIFQVESSLNGNALLEQIRKDREADMRILRELVEAGTRDENLMLGMLVKKNEEQQEAIKTLQRALGALMAMQSRGREQRGPHEIDSMSTSISSFPVSPAVTDSPITFQIPPHPGVHPPLVLPPMMLSAGAYGQTGSEPQVEQADARLESLATGDVPSPRPQEADTPAADDEDQEVDPRRIFLEKALDVLRRHSAATDYGVPDWTITSLEITHEARIASSFFSVVWKGKWQGETVAIKELNSVVDQQLFIKEVEVWRRLKSRHILPFLGASSTTGPPPWILVSPYLENGDVLHYIAQAGTDRGVNRLPLIHQIAQGLEYLHSRDIIHGDFKAANVLISDIGEAVLCDFGLSQLKLDITTKSVHNAESAKALSGTMRWQSPERLKGSSASFACDVYSFGITVCELYDGATPFGYVDDGLVRKSIIDGERPARPPKIPDALWALVNRCWAQNPSQRPTFEQIVKNLETMYELPRFVPSKKLTETSATSSSYTTASEGDDLGDQHAISPELSLKVLPIDLEDCSSSSGSLPSIPTHLEKELSLESDRAERHYRHYLQHDFDDRLSIPLWFPSVVPLGSVGYIRHGQFVKLMDANRPPLDTQDLPPLPVMDEFCSLRTTCLPVNVRNAAERGWDILNSAVTNFIKSSGETAQKTVTRRLTFLLKPGMKQATLVIDDGQFEIYKSFAEAREYLQANIDWILLHYGDSHHIVKEDVILVVGTLTAHNYAMIVSNFAPRTTLTFNIHGESSRQQGQPWGTWSVNRLPSRIEANVRKGFAGSPSADNNTNDVSSSSPLVSGQTRLDEYELKYTCKVSSVSASPQDAVLLAKLRFVPGSAEPTLYP